MMLYLCILCPNIGLQISTLFILAKERQFLPGNLSANEEPVQALTLPECM